MRSVATESSVAHRPRLSASIIPVRGPVEKASCAGLQPPQPSSQRDRDDNIRLQSVPPIITRPATTDPMTGVSLSQERSVFTLVHSVVVRYGCSICIVVNASRCVMIVAGFTDLTRYSPAVLGPIVRSQRIFPLVVAAPVSNILTGECAT